MRQARELGTVEGDCLFQDSKQKLILSGEIPLGRVKLFILGAVSGTEACGVCRGICLSGKAGVLNADEWPVPCQDAEGGLGVAAARGSPQRQRAPLLLGIRHCKPRMLPRSPRSFSGCRTGDEAFPLLQSVQSSWLWPFPCQVAAGDSPVPCSGAAVMGSPRGCLLGLAGVLFLQTGTVTLQVGRSPRVSS